ncbi:MAG TPA: tRNA epoxyqueuosine(34) reductase QueG [Capsulimonadaceae bacterium]|jgi:epoxyqueuosine reductase
MDLSALSSERADAFSDKEAIKQKASSLGFALCGITTAAPPPHHREYKQWLAAGRAGEMIYLHSQEPRRASLDEVLPGAKSVVAVGLNYAGSIDGPIARYARFDDYHETMWARLNQLSAFICDRLPGATAKAYCDTGPVTERDLAMRAGIGWIGKHTNLISRKLGNWFFLGEVIVDVALVPDTPHSTHCGTCFRCQPACPTGAIVGPYELDARRCISYLTIELKGSIPIDLRPLIGTRIYGCDDCLAACPWNKFAVTSTDAAVQPSADLVSPDLVPLLGLDSDAFREKFRNSPIRRTKRRGFLRNVSVALGNAGDPSALPALETARDTDDEPLVREHAAWAITRIEQLRKETKAL